MKDMNHVCKLNDMAKTGVKSPGVSQGFTCTNCFVLLLSNNLLKLNISVQR